MSCEVQLCMFVRNKYIIKTSFIHNIAFSSKKMSRLNQEENMHRPKEPKTVLNKYIGRKQDGLFHWRKHYYELWTLTNMQKKNVSLHKTLIALKLYGLLVDYCDQLFEI